MTKRFTNLEGKQFSNLTVTPAFKYTKAANGRNILYWLCKCDCGNEKYVKAGNLTQGYTKSCGCLYKSSRKTLNRSHGLSKTPEHVVWSAMMARCYNKKSRSYNLYGGSGIIVCKEWHDFLKFQADMGKRPEGCSIDRIKNSKGYSPDNCKWSDKFDQARNRSTTKLNVEAVKVIKVLLKSKTIEQLATAYKVSKNCISKVKSGDTWANVLIPV